MPTAKDIRIAPISSTDANKIIKRLHYSGKTAPNSQLHLGVFLDKRLEGAMQFGPSLDKRKIQQLVTGTGWNEFIELNRLAFSDNLPRNSESRALSIAARLIRKHYPHIKWIISFADAAQCGDGTIYRAAGFLLTGIRRNTQVWIAPTGEIFSRTGLTDNQSKQEQARARRIASRNTKNQPATSNGGASMTYYRNAGWKPLPGYQFRYIYPLDPTVTNRLTVPIIPYADIPKECRMYLGKRASEAGDDPTKGTAAVQH